MATHNNKCTRSHALIEMRACDVNIMTGKRLDVFRIRHVYVSFADDLQLFSVKDPRCMVNYLHENPDVLRILTDGRFKYVA